MPVAFTVPFQSPPILNFTFIKEAQTITGIGLFLTFVVKN
jgi:hypothetical protein